MDWMGWFTPRLRRREPLESLAPPAEEDLEELGRLKAQGSRLELPHPVRLFLIFDHEDDARQFAESVDREAVKANVRAEVDGRWMVTAIQTFVPTPGAVTKVREQLTAAAETHSGRFVAWTAPPVF
jgi:hypothetical protein